MNAHDNESSHNDKQEKKWTIDFTVYAGRAYIAHFFEQAAPEAVNNLKKRISNLQHVLQCSKGKVMQHILYSGITALEEKAQRDGEAPQPGDPDFLQWEIAQEVRSIHEQRASARELEPIYQKYGVDGFKTWCDQRGFDADVFLQQYAWPAVNLKQSDRDRDFLRDYLITHGGEATVSEIRLAADRAGMIDDDELGSWQRFEKNAERGGVIKNYGKWKLP